MQEAELQALIREGDSIDQGAQAHAEAAASGNLDDKGNILQPPDLSAEKAAAWFIFPKALAWAITAVFPETEQFYTDSKCMELAHAIVPVAEKYGLNGPGDSPELALLVGTGMFCVPGYMAYKKRKERAADDSAVAAAGGKAETVKGGAAWTKPIDGSTP